MSFTLPILQAFRGLTSKPGRPQVLNTRRGARWVQNGSVLSEVLSEPGPTHSIFDVLAGVVKSRAKSGTICVLGFGAGGMVAPLRAMGGGHAILGVDLNRDAHRLFRKHCSRWAGDVTVEIAEAMVWLRQCRRRFDVIVEDLSIGRDGDVFKPDISVEELPALISARLKKGGSVVTNLLPSDGLGWPGMLRRVAHRHPEGVQVLFDDFENRVMLSGENVENATRFSRLLRKELAQIRSDIRRRISVRSL